MVTITYINYGKQKRMGSLMIIQKNSYLFQTKI